MPVPISKLNVGLTLPGTNSSFRMGEDDLVPITDVNDFQQSVNGTSKGAPFSRLNRFKGLFNPAGPTPNIVISSGVHVTGDFWLVSARGIHNFGDGVNHYLNPGDIVLFNGTTYKPINKPGAFPVDSSFVGLPDSGSTTDIGPAVNDLLTNSTTDVVYLPAGTFRIVTQIQIPANKKLIGPGSSSCILQIASGATINPVKMAGAKSELHGVNIEWLGPNGTASDNKYCLDAVNVNDIKLKDVRMTGPGKALSAPAGGTGGLVIGGNNQIVEDCLVEHTRGTYGLTLFQNNGTTFKDCLFKDNTFDGVKEALVCNEMEFINCKSYDNGVDSSNNGNGWDIADGRYWRLTNCEAYNNFGSGFQVKKVGALEPSDVRFVNCSSHDNGVQVGPIQPSGGVDFVDSNPDTIVRNTGSWIDDGIENGMTLFVDDADQLSNQIYHTVTGVTATTLTVSGNVVADTADTNAKIYGLFQLHGFGTVGATPYETRNDADATVHRVNYIACEAYNNSGVGFHINGGSEVHLTDCYALKNARGGCELRPDSRRCRLTAVSLMGNGLGVRDYQLLVLGKYHRFTDVHLSGFEPVEDGVGSEAGTNGLTVLSPNNGKLLFADAAIVDCRSYGMLREFGNGIDDINADPGEWIEPDRGGIFQTAGYGSPEGVVTAPIASMFFRLDGGAGTTLYVKESGTGNTGWAAV